MVRVTRSHAVFAWELPKPFTCYRCRVLPQAHRAWLAFESQPFPRRRSMFSLDIRYGAYNVRYGIPRTTFALYGVESVTYYWCRISPQALRGRFSESQPFAQRRSVFIVDT